MNKLICDLQMFQRSLLVKAQVNHIIKVEYCQKQMDHSRSCDLKRQMKEFVIFDVKET